MKDNDFMLFWQPHPSLTCIIVEIANGEHIVNHISLYKQDLYKFAEKIAYMQRKDDEILECEEREEESEDAERSQP